jgi:hypothetical protein
MAARILPLQGIRSMGEEGERRRLSPAPDRFLFWQGASGRRYVHTVYSLIECPALSAANYILVRSGGEGRREAVRIGRVEHGAPTLNLAEIRRLGAALGADEVHIHLLAADTAEAKVIEFDLRAGQFEALSAQPPQSRSLH